ncbi:MAG: hypothetical protein HY670_09335, partial [Chloroflexi bacterium]|nr:hypothetical protein [Chloroflexota bacterium]
MAGKKRTSVSEYPTQPFIWIKQSKWQTILNIATLISVLITIGSILYTYRQNFNQNTVNKSLLDDNKLRLQENAQQIEDNNRLLERTMVILAGGPVDEELLAMMPPALIEKLIGETSSDGSSFLAGVSKQNLEELRSKFVNTSGKPYLNLGTTSIALDAQKAARASEKAAQSAGNAAKAALVILAGGNIDSDWLKTLSPELLTKLTEKGFLRYVNGQPYLESGTLRIALDAYDAAKRALV